MLCGEDEVRGQRQLEAAAHRHAADRSDHRLVEVAQLLQAAEAADTVVAVDGVAASRRLQVPAGGEEPVPRRGDNGAAQLGIVAEVLDGLAPEPAGRTAAHTAGLKSPMLHS